MFPGFYNHDPIRKGRVEEDVEQGFGKDDFRIYAGTGYEGIAYPNLTPRLKP